MTLVAAFAIGIILGCVVTKIFMSPKKAGVLYVYDTDEGSQLFLKSWMETNDIRRKKTVIYTVTDLETNSQK